MKPCPFDLMDTIDQKHRQADAVCVGISALVETGADDGLMHQLALLASELILSANNASQELWPQIKRLAQDEAEVIHLNPNAANGEVHGE